MSLERWKSFFDIMTGAGVYPADLDWASGIDLRFLPQKS
jgi:hypothetical protein